MLPLFFSNVKLLYIIIIKVTFSNILKQKIEKKRKETIYIQGSILYYNNKSNIVKYIETKKRKEKKASTYRVQF